MGVSAQNILQTDPDYLRRQLEQQEMQRLNPSGSAAGAIGAFLGRGLGNVTSGRGFFETADPALKRVSEVQGLMKNVPFDANNPQQYYKDLATQLSSAGYADLAPLAAAEAAKFTTKGGDTKVLPPGAVLVDAQGNIIAEGKSPRGAGGEGSFVKTSTNFAEVAGELGFGVKENLADYTPEQMAKINTTIRNNKKTNEENSGVRVGFDKTGRYTNQYGQIFPATEMSKNRTGFQSAETLLSKLNTITASDIKQAEGLDYTSGETAKQIGGRLFSKTLKAQTKIAASQLLEQIEKLPPGSASDADMRVSKTDFPGYGNADALEAWVKRTKELLEQSLERQADLYGFKRRVIAGPLNATDEKPKATTQKGTTGSSQLPPGVTVKRKQ
jgi:hypothetical protein